MLVKDLVQANPNAKFKNDVILDWYPAAPENLEMAKCYMFSGKSSSDRKASAELLEIVRDAFLYSGNENRITVIATYGHGKSHLALAMANFFGMPKNTPEATAILGQLVSSLNDSTRTNAFHQFKEREPYLVIRLGGDKHGDVTQQFLTGLERALSEYDTTKDIKLPFWFDKAQTFFGGLTPEQIDKVNIFLNDKGLDLSILKQKIDSRDASAYNLSREVVEHLTGVSPDWSGQIGLDKAIEWVTDEHCGDGKPFSGVLILFDEFSAFVRDFADPQNATVGVPLLALLNGVGKRRGKVVFVAFSQHDPEAVARAVYGRARNKEHFDSVVHELNRLPQSCRLLLESVMESVIDAYLAQNNDWKEVMGQHGCWHVIEEATEVAFNLCKKRYNIELGWKINEFLDIVSHGAYPLHPLTTALLCSIDFRETANPRAVLGFVIDEVNKRSDQLAVIDGKPNWIYPIELVDEFKDQLAGKEYEDYQETRRNADSSLSNDEISVLKAMLLQGIAKLPCDSGQGYTGVIAHLSGVGKGAASKALSNLEQAGHVRYNPVSKTYGFWSVGHTAKIVKDKLLQECAGRKLASADLVKCNGYLTSFGASPIPVSCKWGHQEDWAAKQVIITKEFYNPQFVRSLVRSYGMDPHGTILSGERACIIWAIASNADDVQWFRDNGQSILDEAFEKFQPAVTVIVPEVPTPELEISLIQFLVIKDWPQEKLKDLGIDQCNYERKRIEESIKDQLTSITQYSSNYFVLKQLSAGVRAGVPISNVPKLVQRCVEIAYNASPSSFYTQYKENTTNLRKSVSTVAKLLATDTLSRHFGVLQAQAQDLVKGFLKVGFPDSWGILTADERVRKPANARLDHSWALLDEAFSEGGMSTRVRDVVLRLLNAPYGFDVNTLTLLFCAWLGCNRSSLVLSSGSRVCSLNDVLEKLGTERPMGFLTDVCYTSDIHIARKAPDALAKIITDIINRINDAAQQRLTQVESQDFLAQLSVFFKDLDQEQEIRGKAEKAYECLKADLFQSKEFETKAGDIVRIARAATNSVETVVKQLNAIGELKEPATIVIAGPRPAEIRSEVMALLKQVVENRCKEYERLPDLTAYKANQVNLRQIKQTLTGVGSQPLIDRIELAMQNLVATHDGLQAKAKDGSVRATLNEMRTDGPLVNSRQSLTNLENMVAHAEDTKNEIAQKKLAIERNIKTHLEFVSSISTKIKALASEKDANTLSLAIAEKRLLYEDTGEQVVISNALKKCGALQDFFARLKTVMDSSIETPEKACTIKNNLQVLADEFSTILSDAQKEQVGAIRLQLDNSIRGFESDANAWLVDMTRLVEKGEDWDKLFEKLQNVPPFLPTSELSKLDGIKITVKTARADDKVGVVLRNFKEIGDREKQIRCLKQLQEELEL